MGTRELGTTSRLSGTACLFHPQRLVAIPLGRERWLRLATRLLPVSAPALAVPGGSGTRRALPEALEEIPCSVTTDGCSGTKRMQEKRMGGCRKNVRYF